MLVVPLGPFLVSSCLWKDTVAHSVVSLCARAVCVLRVSLSSICFRRRLARHGMCPLHVSAKTKTLGATTLFSADMCLCVCWGILVWAVYRSHPAVHNQFDFTTRHPGRHLNGISQSTTVCEHNPTHFLLKTVCALSVPTRTCRRVTHLTQEGPTNHTAQP